MIAGLAGALGIGAFVAAYFSGLLNALLPSPARLAGLIRQRDLPLPAGERFVVLIADPQGDDDKRTHTRHVAAALEPYRGLDAVPVGPGPEWGIESRDAFEAKARALLAERRGDVVISGDVATAGKGLRLRILPGDASISALRETPQGRRPGEYTLTETGLPLHFDQDFNAVLVALVVASVAPAIERQRHYLVDVLEPAASRLKHLCANIPAGLNPRPAGRPLACTRPCGRRARRTVGPEPLARAGGARLSRGPRGHDPRARPARLAMTQNNLGNALSTLGEREDRTERLEQACPLSRRPRGHDPRARPARLGHDPGQPRQRAPKPRRAREDGTERLEQAVQAYRGAPEVFRPAGASQYVGVAETNLARAEALLTSRRGASAAEWASSRTSFAARGSSR